MLKKILSVLLTLVLCNVLVLQNTVALHPVVFVIILLLLFAFYFIYGIIPEYFIKRSLRHMTLRLRALLGGCTLLSTAAYCAIIEIILYIIMVSGDFFAFNIEIINALIAGTLLFLIAANGFFRILIFSKQVSVVRKLLLLLLWWVPIVNIFYIRKITKIAKTECIVESDLIERDQVRAENQICRTKYPILMVHGVFFRDWQYFNYWGRIPNELTRNGANVFYGKQESARRVAESGTEVAAQIERVLKETGAARVNIIAHSKGGLDSRYAVSRLGMADKVASLTTINTPHYGCAWVDVVIKKVPESLFRFVENRYNRIFKRAGDENPDFRGAVYDLTEANAARFNLEVPNQPDILYQSVMSKMKHARSAGFPLNIAYHLIRRIQKKDNDGLVPVDSAVWGDYLGLITVKGRRGISHADMIDLFRENIPGFECRSFYIHLIEGLKNKGY